MPPDTRGLTDETGRRADGVRLSSQAPLPVAALPHGDQRKREVALMLALEPKVCMFDDPTAGKRLDEVPGSLDPIAGIKADPAAPVQPVEHRMDVIRCLADRIEVLHSGALVADGTPAEVVVGDVMRAAGLGREPTDV
jgi:branched-chain amino acid transport system ATP-binding protein